MKRIITVAMLLMVMAMLAPGVSAQGQIERPKPSDPNPAPKPKTYLKVDGESSSTNISFQSAGGTQTLSVSTNASSVPLVSSLPWWISVNNVSKTEISISCQANNSESARSDWFDVSAGKRSVRVYVSQSAGKTKITGIKFGNVKADGTVINNYGETMYASDICYLSPKITYNGPGTSQSKTLYVKLFKSDGSLSTGSSSPDGYSYTCDVTFQPGNNNTLVLTGWGSESGGTYKPGNTTFELYCDGEKIYTGSVMLNRQRGESSYLRVNDQTSLSASYSSSGGTKKYNVSTDGSDWKIIGLPSFCEVTDKTSGSFSLICKPNMGDARSDYLIVSTDNQQVRLDISQSAGTGMKINKVWTDHNVFHNGVKGMMIHVEFETEGLKGHTVKPCAFFYREDGTKLVGYSNSGYVTSDGQLTVQESTTVSYDSSIWNDFKLFMPNSQLPKESESISCKYHIQIIDKTTNKWSAESEFQSFQINGIKN